MADLWELKADTTCVTCSLYICWSRIFTHHQQTQPRTLRSYPFRQLDGRLLDARAAPVQVMSHESSKVVPLALLTGLKFLLHTHRALLRLARAFDREPAAKVR